MTMTQPQILLNNINFSIPNGKVIFNNLTLAFSQYKIGLVGRNGIGKSTLIKLLSGELSPSASSIHLEGKLAYVPQNSSLTEDQTIAAFLECEEKISALQRIF